MKAVLKVRYRAQRDYIDNGPVSRPKRKSREPSRYRTQQDYVEPKRTVRDPSSNVSSRSNAKVRKRVPAKVLSPNLDQHGLSALDCSSATKSKKSTEASKLKKSTETSKLQVHPTLSLCTVRSARYDSSPQKCATVFNVQDGRTIFAISNKPKHKIMQCSDADIACNERSYSATLRPHRPDSTDVLGSDDEWDKHDEDEESLFGTSPSKEVADNPLCNATFENRYDDPREEANEDHLNNHNEIFHNSSIMHHQCHLIAALKLLQNNQKILVD